MKPSHPPLRVSVVQGLSAHHAAIQLLWVRMRQSPLLCLAVRAAFAVEAARRVTQAGQAGVKGVWRQRAGEEVVVWAQIVSLSGGGAGQTQILVVGTSSSAADPVAGGRLLPSHLPDLSTKRKALLLVLSLRQWSFKKKKKNNNNNNNVFVTGLWHLTHSFFRKI